MTVEPLLILTGSGLDIYMENGSTFSIDQVFNTVMILLFSDPTNYHHDVFLKDKNWKSRGNYFTTLKKSITIQMLSDLGNAIESDLKPLIDNNIITDLDSTSKNPTGNKVETNIYFKYDGEPIDRTIVYDNETIIIR